MGRLIFDGCIATNVRQLQSHQRAPALRPPITAELYSSGIDPMQVPPYEWIQEWEF